MTTLKNKICIECLVELTTDNTYAYDINASQYICSKCRKLRDKQKYINKKEIIREQQRIYDLKLKIKIIEAYGNKCICCNEKSIEFLTIYSSGKKTDKKSGGKLYRWLIKNNFPKDKYQLLCYNCNSSNSLFGYCPHNKLR